MRNQLDFSSQLGGNPNKSTNDNLLSGGFIPVRVVEVNIIPEKNNKSLFQVAGPGDDSKKYNNLTICS